MFFFDTLTPYHFKLAQCIFLANNFVCTQSQSFSFLDYLYEKESLVKIMENTIALSSCKKVEVLLYCDIVTTSLCVFYLKINTCHDGMQKRLLALFPPSVLKYHFSFCATKQLTSTCLVPVNICLFSCIIIKIQ